MAVADHAVAGYLAKHLATALRREPAARRLWVWSEMGYIEPGRDYVEVWLLMSADIDDDTESRLADILASLHDLVPDANISAHRFTLAMAGGRSAMETIRAGAEEIPLHPA